MAAGWSPVGIFVGTSSEIACLVRTQRKSFDSFTLGRHPDVAIPFEHLPAMSNSLIPGFRQLRDQRSQRRRVDGIRIGPVQTPAICRAECQRAPSSSIERAVEMLKGEKIRLSLPGANSW